MRSTFFSLLFFGLILSLSAMDYKFLMSPDSDKDVIFTDLTDAEKKTVMKLTEEFADSMQEDKTLVQGLDSNCQCSNREPSCTCLLKLSFMNLNVLYAVGYTPADRSIVVIVAIDGYIIVNDEIKISASEPYKPPCISLPPPTFWMAGCFEMKITEDNQGFTICGTVDLEISAQARSKRICSMDFTCLVHEKVNGEDRLALKYHSVDGGDVALKNIRVAKGFESAAQEFNMLKMARMMKKGSSSDGDDDSLDQSFWKQMDEHEPPEERSFDSANAAEKVNWWLIGKDEVPYLTILFKGFVAPALKSAQGIDNFQMIKNAIKKATPMQRSDWHQKVLPDVFEPGLSCGGALLSPNKVLTLCACIRSFYHQNKYNKPAPGTGSKFDIKINGSSDIFLEFSGTQFMGHQYHHLDRNANNYDAQSSCFKLIDSGADGQQATMVVMPITPKIAAKNPYYYVLWPPYPIHEKFKQGHSGNLVAFGTMSKESLNFTDPGGRVIDPKTRAVSILLKRGKTNDYCIKETFEKQSIPEPFKTKTTCFHSKENQLCKGIVGFPITNGDDLAGLMASPIECDGKDGSVMGAIFDDEIVKEIETNEGKDIKTRRLAAHSYLYREPTHIVHIIPDYTTSDATPKPPPRSRAEREACSTFSVIFFLSICQISILTE